MDEKKKYPVKISVLADLASYGFSKSSISFDSISLTSRGERICVSVKKNEGGPASVNIINPRNGSKTGYPLPNCEKCIIHPSSPFLAVQINEENSNSKRAVLFDYGTKFVELSKCVNLNERDMGFWKWISDETVLFVISKTVYFWNVFENTFEKKFQIDEEFENAVVIDCSFHRHAEGQYVHLKGFKRREGKTVGVIQVHNVDKNHTQVFEGFAATFFKTKVNTRFRSFFAVIRKEKYEGIVSIFKVQEGDFKKTKLNVSVDYFKMNKDFPVALHIFPSFGFCAIVTKFSFLLLYEIDSGELVLMKKLCKGAIFRTVGFEDGFVGVSLDGLVLEVNLSYPLAMEHLINNGKANPAALVFFRVAKHRPDLLFDNNEIHIKFLDLLLAEKCLEHACRMVVALQELRTIETIKKFKEKLPETINGVEPINMYFKTIKKCFGKYNEDESIVICEMALEKEEGYKYIHAMLEKKELTCSKRLYDVLVGNVDESITKIVEIQLL